MLRITNVIPVYGDGDVITSYNISVDNGVLENAISANLTLEPAEIDLKSILEVCKQKMQEAVAGK